MQVFRVAATLVLVKAKSPMVDDKRLAAIPGGISGLGEGQESAEK
jgi:hypothetical protein